MSQHFLMSAAARSLSERRIWLMSDEEAEATFAKIRWASNGGKPFCPKCGCTTVYDCRRASGASRWRCKECLYSFSVTAKTIFASRKLSYQHYLVAILVFCNEVKGKAALALSRSLDVQYKTAFVLAHKMREAIASEVRGMVLGGDGVTVTADGSPFGGYIKPANLKENRIDRRLAENRSPKEKWAVGIRERNGRTIMGVFTSEAESVGFIRRRVAPGTTLVTDSAGAWNIFEAFYKHHTVNHDEAYSQNGVHTNDMETVFARLARAEKGHHHHFAGIYFLRYAQEAAWREDHSRFSNGEQVSKIARLALASRPSVDFSGYWQRRRVVPMHP
jgi:transposase-like protein